MKSKLVKFVKRYAEANGLSSDDPIWKDITTIKGAPHQWLTEIDHQDFYIIPQNEQKLYEQKLWRVDA